MDTVLITGTTSGIGKAFAEKFASMGDNIVLVSRNGEKLQQQQIDLQSRYQVSVECISCDLAEDGAAELIASKARELGLSVDVLINNAGFNEAGYFTDTRLSKELDMIQVHIKVLTALTKLFFARNDRAWVWTNLKCGFYGSLYALSMRYGICCYKSLCSVFFKWALSRTERNWCYGYLFVPWCNKDPFCRQGKILRTHCFSSSL